MGRRSLRGKTISLTNKQLASRAQLRAPPTSPLPPLSPTLAHEFLAQLCVLQLWVGVTRHFSARHVVGVADNNYWSRFFDAHSDRIHVSNATLEIEMLRTIHPQQLLSMCAPKPSVRAAEVAQIFDEAPVGCVKRGMALDHETELFFSPLD